MNVSADEKRAAKVLPCTISGTVLKGRGEGADMGFRTANLNIDEESLPVPHGVYAAYATIDHTTYPTAVSVGASPTFDDGTLCNIEAHILGFSGDLYGKTISLKLVEYLRPMIKFTSTDELIQTVKADIQYIKEHF